MGTAKLNKMCEALPKFLIQYSWLAITKEHIFSSYDLKTIVPCYSGQRCMG